MSYSSWSVCCVCGAIVSVQELWQGAGECLACCGRREKSTIDPDILREEMELPSPPPKLDEAATFLRRALSNGPKFVDVVCRLARDQGISEATLRRAKRLLGVISLKHEFLEPGRVWKS